MNDTNDKIKELAKKAYAADSIVRNPEWKHTEITEHLLANLDSFFVEFAKLVAEDCANIVHRSADYDDGAAQEILYQYNVDNCRSAK